MKNYVPKSYEIISGVGFRVLEDNANIMCAKGYTPVGGILRIENQSGAIEYFQAMYKPLAKKTRKKATNKYSDNFLHVWGLYPKRSGSNPKAKAYRSWVARIGVVSDANTSVESMRQGTKRYWVWCEATGKINTEYVMQAATFFGPEKHYLNDWTIPVDNQLPKSDLGLVGWAEKKFGKKGAPNPGESMSAYRIRLTNMLQS